MAEQDNDDPLAVELATLRTAVAQFQKEAHSSALRLQHHFVTNSNVLERNKSLDWENVCLCKELAVLRANPMTPQSANIQVQELTLALRRISDKILFTKESLSACKLELANAQSHLVKAKHANANAYALAAAAQGREEEGLICKHNLQLCLHLAEQDRKMSDHDVHEYADLTPTPTSLFFSSANASSTTLVDNLAQCKSDVQELLGSFNAESTGLQRDIARLQEELHLYQCQLATEQEGSAHNRAELTKALTELERLNIDNKAAAKMVSRYMKFSQSTVTSLQLSLTALTTHYTATHATLLAELDDAHALLTHQNEDMNRLQGALDKISADLACKAYGRHREVALRLTHLCQEEQIFERLKRWTLHLHELAETCDTCKCHTSQVLENVLNDAQHVLCDVDGEKGADYQPSVQLSHLIVAQGAVSMLTEELTAENER